MDVFAGCACRADTTTCVRHDDNPIAHLQACRLSSINHDANSLMPKFARVRSRAPPLPLRTHGRNQDFDLDDVTRRLRLCPLRDLRLARSYDFYTKNGRYSFFKVPAKRAALFHGRLAVPVNKMLSISRFATHYIRDVTMRMSEQ